MLAAALLLLQAVPYPAPTPEALALGRRLAESGTLAGLLPLVAARETDELVAAHPELTAAEQADLRRTAAATLATGREKLFAAQGRAYAERLSVADLRVLVAHAADPAAARMRAALPGAIAATMQGAGELDFKRDAAAAFCSRTGKLCPK